MPPLVDDNRLDARIPTGLRSTNAAARCAPVPLSTNSNIGDDSTGSIRLRRVWDTWSTDYTQAPATGINDPTTVPPVGPIRLRDAAGLPVVSAPLPGAAAGHPDPDPGRRPPNQRIKVLTIRQDFTRQALGNPS